MLIVLCVLLGVVVIALAVVNVKARRRVDDLVARDAQRSKDLQRANAELREASTRNAELTTERDDALERVQRSRRDAAQVAERLHSITGDHDAQTARLDELDEQHGALGERHESLIAEHESLLERCAAVTEERDALLRRPAPTVDDGDPSPLDSEVVWALTLARIDRIWRVSVATALDEVSPLATSSALFVDALDVVVRAAREEAGAIVDLDIDGSGDIDGATATTVVCLVEELVSSAIAVADETTVTVSIGDDAVYVAVTAETSGTTVAVPGPASLAGADGRYRVERAGAEITG